MAAAAGPGRQAIENQLKICGFKSDLDVLALYLARQGLRSIPSLSQFRRLKYLWVNNNKIQDLTFLIKNYCLTELYLNNNELTDISGALKHLCSLQILFLHNNELKKLGKTVKELKGMRSLQTLRVASICQNVAYLFLKALPCLLAMALHWMHSKTTILHQVIGKTLSLKRFTALAAHNCSVLGDLFQNPLAYDPDYRLYVIYFLPSVQLLDRKCCEFGNNTNKVPFENPEDAVLVRALTRSLTEFSSMDWNKVATCQERRLENKAEKPFEKLTVLFR